MGGGVPGESHFIYTLDSTPALLMQKYKHLLGPSKVTKSRNRLIITD